MRAPLGASITTTIQQGQYPTYTTIKHSSIDMSPLGASITVTLQKGQFPTYNNQTLQWCGHHLEQASRRQYSKDYLYNNQTLQHRHVSTWSKHHGDTTERTVSYLQQSNTPVVRAPLGASITTTIQQGQYPTYTTIKHSSIAMSPLGASITVTIQQGQFPTYTTIKHSSIAICLHLEQASR